MTHRSSFAQHHRELRAALFARIARRAFTRKTTGLDGIAKKLIATQASPVAHDPDLDQQPDTGRIQP